MANQNFLSRMHRDYKANTSNITKAKREKLSSIDKLKKLKELEGTEEILEVYVDYSDSETGDLYHYDGLNICYLITADELKKLYPGYVPRGNSYLLGTTFKVRVKEVDESKGIVELYAVENEEVSLEQYKKRASNIHTYGSEAAALHNYIMSALNDDIKKPLVRGTVTKVEVDRIFLDLFDKGVEAVIPVKNYTAQYRRNLQNEVSVGDSLKGVVFAYRARPTKDGGKEEEKHFLVSTVGFIPDPWKTEKVRHLKPKDIIVVQCVEKPTREKALYFWGVSNMLPGIDILCDYTMKVPETAVKEGHFYKCKVGMIDARRHKLTVAPFEECRSYQDTKDSL